MKKTNPDKSHLLMYALFILLFSIFIFTYNIRWQLLFPFGQRTYLWSINFFAYISLLLFVYAKCFPFTKMSLCFYCVPIISTIFPFFTLYAQNAGWGYIGMLCSCCIFSVYFIFIELPDETRPHLLKKCILFLNILACIMLIWSVIDRMFEQVILKEIAKIMSNVHYYEMYAYPEVADHRRFYSFLGQPLTNTLFFNFVYVINLLYNEKHKPLVPSWLYCVLMVPALAACGSKAGLIIYIIITLSTFYNNRKVLAVFAATSIIVVASGLMNNLIYRLLNQPLTTGRYETLKWLLSNPNFPFMFFKGYGTNIDIGYSLAALELAPISFAFCYGIVFTCLILGTVFVYVTWKLFRKGTIRMWILWCLLFAEVNSYADMTITWDTSLMFYVLTMIILNLAAEKE